ncbi:ATP-binding protein [Polycladomyces subterraneus]|uniref:histidine kinase n=1 Tax=Polycladomyces subterraneus TaxID=1016997 RepID=A0ABT8II06_9BACL|nr:ATP-binding protein [Polycladomyces subterraneus]MDN4592387.1 PAS domain S-box protein [Polycladomyces subterraneus]
MDSNIRSYSFPVVTFFAFAIIVSFFSVCPHSSGLLYSMVVTFLVLGCIIDSFLHYQTKTLSESVQQYKTLFERTPDAIYYKDIMGRYTSFNPACEKLTGYSVDEMMQMTLSDWVLPEDYERVKNHVRRALKGEPQHFETAIVRKNGEIVQVKVSYLPMIKENRIAGIYGIAKDITEYKKTDELLQRSEKLSAVGQLAAGVAHEIRNPLTALKGFLQLQRHNSNQSDEHLSIMLAELERIDQIVSELLVLSKPQTIQFSPVDLLRLLEQVIMLINTQAIMNNVEIVISEFDSEIPTMMGEENQLKQLLINLLKNAIEAMPNGGIIDIRCRMIRERSVLIRITDQGCGIPEEQLQKISEPFFSTKAKGTGLGLVVSHRIVENHRGKLTITSQPGQGTRVDIVLPVQIPPSSTG